MRQLKLFLIVAGLLLAGVLTISLYGGKVQAASIVGSPHDLSGRGWGTNEICIFCHTPHNAKSPQLVPLWNHASTAATFTLYSSSTLNAVPGQPSNNSKACLSCHDGTVALDSYGARTGTNFISGGALLGTDLSNDHPISFTYDAALATADGALVTPANASQVVAGIPLYTAKVECASCHDVHNPANGDFLRFSNAGSALCLKCHIK
jgi:predicted CXXCH cytochrome family protein